MQSLELLEGDRVAGMFGCERLLGPVVCVAGAQNPRAEAGYGLLRATLELFEEGVSRAGFEPATQGLKVLCSTKLS